MKKERFKEIVNNYSSTSGDMNSLKKLASDYPFSQVVHLLLAKASKQDDPSNFKPTLSNAAFHTTDRSILKSLIELNLVPSERKITAPSIATKPIDTTTTLTQPIKSISRQVDTDLLIAEVLDNLEILQQTKKEASSWLDDKPIAPTKKKSPKTTISKKTTKSKKQSTIIEKFIKEEPRIKKNASPVNDKEDMAKESSLMRDDVVSEALANIYKNQGKTERAIDIYKKLIWKYPQKKALFAAQIEKLKKK